ncbi:MAG: hypothetical protein ABI488_10085 [Polyangiaceae bacterium]
MLTAYKLSQRAFKYGPPQSARSWRALVGDFSVVELSFRYAVSASTRSSLQGQAAKHALDG